MNQNSKSRAMSAMIQQISHLDQAVTERELEPLIPELLHTVCDYTQSDRAHLFEWVSDSQQSFQQTFFWTVQGAEPLMDQLSQIPALPDWVRRLEAGQAVIVRDMEKDSLPADGKWFQQQGIRSMAAFPIVARQRLLGFVGVDNPRVDLEDDSIQLLSAIGGHLGNLRENLRMQRVLEEKNAVLEWEKRVLDALSITYNSLYACDLSRDTITPLKRQPESLGYQMDQELGRERSCFSQRMKHLYQHYVLHDGRQESLLNLQELEQRLTREGRITLHMHGKPNRNGCSHFEMSMVRLQSDDGFQVVLGFRYIDELVAQEENRRRQLEKALRDTQASMDTISAIGKLYWLIYRLDLPTDTYQEIAADGHMHHSIGESGRTSQRFTDACQRTTDPAYVDTMLTFLDAATLPSRLRDRETISQEYLTITGNWHVASFVVQQRDGRGTPVKVLYVVRIINDQKRQEMEYERKLARSVEEAQRANLAKDDFLRRMSHDIRTPINAIRGMVQIANHYSHDCQKLQECRDKVWQASGYLLALVNDVLDMNKLESGSMVLDHKPFDLMRLLAEVNNVAEMHSMEQGLRYAADWNPSRIAHPDLVGSPTHIKQILLNLVGNAVKYNKMGGEIRLSCREGAFDGEKAVFCFTCADTGIGMSPDFQKHAFEPFTQEGKNDARTRYAGSGLGLSIVKSLTEQMGGQIKLTSRENVGTVFTITLPIEVDRAPAPKQPAPQAARKADITGARVLLVEDNDLNLEIAQFMLEKAGANVTTACNGKEALETFAAAKPGFFDAILMDVMMPVMDGLEATRAIRGMQRPDARTTPIIAMTANAFADDILQCKAAGMNEHLSKPLDDQLLIQTIAAYYKPAQ